MFLWFKNEENGKFNNLVNDFFYPLLTKDKDVSKMKKAARRMNFFAYCNAGQVYLQIEKRIHEKLVSDGYIEKEIEEILSQISLVSIATDKKLDDAYATSVLFKDVNDADVYDKYSKMCEKTMIQNNRNSTLGRIRNGIIYGFFGTGEHDLKHYFDDENIVKGSLCSTVSKLVENSILNDNSEELLPISRELLTPIILKNNAEFLSNSVILDRLDNSLNYGNVSRYTEEEHQELLEYEHSLKGNVNRL